jgi:hypothetical protein
MRCAMDDQASLSKRQTPGKTPREPTPRHLTFDETSNSMRDNEVMTELSNQVGQLALDLQKMRDDMKKWDKKNTNITSEDTSDRSRLIIKASDMKASGGDASNAPGETICLPSGAKVTPKFMKSALQGEFILQFKNTYQSTSLLQLERGTVLQ